MSITGGANAEAIIDDFRTNAQGKLDDAMIEEGVAMLKAEAATAPFSATLSVVKMEGYNEWQVAVKDGKTFRGRSVEPNPLGDQMVEGFVFASLDILYAETASFSFSVTSTHIILYFFNSRGGLRGNLQAAPHGGSGFGGGPGSWS